MPKKQPSIITGSRLEQIKEELNITLYDYSWFLGLYSASFSKVIRDKAADPVDHAVAGLARYLLLSFPELPLPVDQFIITQHERAHNQLTNLKQRYKELGAVIKVGGKIVDLDKIAHLGAVIFRSKSSAYQYASGKSSIVLSVSHWVSIVQWAIESENTELINRVIADEMAAHGYTTKETRELLLNDGWA